jgi:hypothetical protein
MKTKKLSGLEGRDDLHRLLRTGEYFDECECQACSRRFQCRGSIRVSRVSVEVIEACRSTREADAQYSEIKGLSQIPDSYASWRAQYLQGSEWGDPYAYKRMLEYVTPSMEDPIEIALLKKSRDAQCAQRLKESKKFDRLMWTGFVTVFGSFIGMMITTMITQPPVWVAAFVIPGTIMVIYAIARK